jgi:hypothetical protein
LLGSKYTFVQLRVCIWCCWPCMCGIIFCRYARWSRDHHVRAEHQLPLWSENGTRRLFCSASTILKPLDICYIYFLTNFPVNNLFFIYLFNVIFLSIYILLNHIFPIFYFSVQTDISHVICGRSIIKHTHTQKERKTGSFSHDQVLYNMHELFKSRLMNHGQHKTSFHQHVLHSHFSV